MKITRKPWIKVLRQLAKLYISSKVVAYMKDDGIYVYEPHMQVFVPYPNVTKFPEGAINLVDLLRALTPLNENFINVFPEGGILRLQEDCVTIRIPQDSNSDASAVLMPHAEPANKIKVKELPSALLALRAAIGGARAAGITDYIYWEGSKLYSFNGTMLGIAEFHKCPVKRILIPKILADFVSAMEAEEPSCTVQVYTDKSVSLDFGDYGKVRFTQPDLAPMDWNELTPKEPGCWFPVPALFFRLPQIALSLADRHHSKIKLTWEEKRIVAEGTGEFALQFSLDENIGIIGMKSGMVDILALNPILSYAQRMGWGKDYLVFSSHLYRFYCMLQPVDS